jgi:iron complex outermembrane receptor protein
MLSWAAMTPSQAASVEPELLLLSSQPFSSSSSQLANDHKWLEDVPAVDIRRDGANDRRDCYSRPGRPCGPGFGMVFALAADDGLALTVRGVGTPARPQALDQSIALFLDGTYLAKGALYPLALFDVERVEVVRGPHSTEVGKNASVGALSVVSREPGATNALDGAGSWDAERGGYALEAGADLQLGSDSALRLAGAHFDRHGWVRNDATGNDVPEDQDSGVRLTLRTQPTERLSGVLRFQVGDRERLGNAAQLVGPPGSVPAGAGDSTLDDHSFALTPRGDGGDSHHETRAHIASAHFDFNTGDHSWVSETAWVDFDGSTLDDVDFNASANVDFLRDQKFHQISQELRVASPAGGTLEYLAGVFYLSSSWHSVETEYWNTPGFPPGHYRLPVSSSKARTPTTSVRTRARWRCLRMAPGTRPIECACLRVCA